MDVFGLVFCFDWLLFGMFGVGGSLFIGAGNLIESHPPRGAEPLEQPKAHRKT